MGICISFLDINNYNYKKKINKQRVVVSICKNCTLVQLRNPINKKKLFPKNYSYHSGNSQEKIKNFKSILDEIKKINPSYKLKILDVGSNDNSFVNLSNKKYIYTYGIEPTDTYKINNFHKNKIYNFILSLKLKKRYQINYKIIFSDDKSSDSTRKIIKEIIKKNKNVKLVTPKKKLGLGHALNIGIKNLKQGYVIFIDSDVTITKSSFLNLVKNRKKNTMIVGSRYLKESRGNNFKTRIFLSKLMNYLFAKFFNTKIIDLTHSFRIFDLNVKLDSKNLKHPGYFLEISINYLKNGNLDEKPIIYSDRIYGSSKISLLSIIFSLTFSLYVLIFKKKKIFFYKSLRILLRSIFPLEFNGNLSRKIIFFGIM